MAIEHEYTDRLVCPYCGHIEVDSFECASESDDYQCGICDKRFTYTTQVHRTFTSEKADCLNGLAEHSWRPIGGVQREYPGARRCTVCNRREYPRKEK